MPTSTPTIEPQIAQAEQEITRTNTPQHPLVQHLQQQLANSVVLLLNYKVYHWQAMGPFFRDLHKNFDEFAEATTEIMDEIAERLRMIGQDPNVELEQIAEWSTVKQSTPSRSMRQMIEEADRNAILVIREFREAVHAAEKADDPGSVDLLSSAIRVHEKHEWYLREMLKETARLGL